MTIRGSYSPDGEQRTVCNSDEFVTAAVTVAATATVISAANPNRKYISIHNASADTSIFVGPSTVTTATGLEVPFGTTLTLQGAITTAAIYGIVAADTEPVRIMEF